MLVISGFRREVANNFALMGHYVAKNSPEERISQFFALVIPTINFH